MPATVRAEEKTKIFVANLKPEIGDSVAVRRSPNTRESIAGAVRIAAKQVERARDRCAVGGAAPPGLARARSVDSRRGLREDVPAGPRHAECGGCQKEILAECSPKDGLRIGRHSTSVSGVPSEPPCGGNRRGKPGCDRGREVPPEWGGSGGNAGNKPRVLCYECGQEGHYRAKRRRRSETDGSPTTGGPVGSEDVPSAAERRRAARW